MKSIQDQSEELARRIASSAGIRELTGIKWRLRGPGGEHVGLDAGFDCAFVPEGKGQVFDGRDNEQAKRIYYSRALGVALTIEVL